jgi:hypothetical protein
MHALINIGLNRNNGADAHVARHEIRNAFERFEVVELKYREALPEPGTEVEGTYIAHVSGWSRDKAWKIAAMLDQDAIAQYDLAECEGDLVGPNASVWGPFDPEYFKLL